MNFLNNFLNLWKKPVYKPKKCLWIDRSWKTDIDKYIKQGQDLSLARFGLFVNPSDNNPLKDLSAPYFMPFVKVDEYKKYVEKCYKNNIGVDMTCWIWPHKKYTEELLKYFLEIKREFPDVRLDLDTEFAFASKLVNDSVRKEISQMIYSQVDPRSVSVNDYASLQNQTRYLIVDGVRIRPQAYSVGYVTRKGQKIITESTSIYYPGRTQRYAMSSSKWGSYKQDKNPLDIGIALYKPVKGLTIQQQVDMQFQECLKYKPEEIWGWQFNGLNTDYYKAFKKA